MRGTNVDKQDDAQLYQVHACLKQKCDMLTIPKDEEIPLHGYINHITCTLTLCFTSRTAVSVKVLHKCFGKNGSK